MFSMCGSMGGCPWSTCVIGLTGQRVGEGKEGGGRRHDGVRGGVIEGGPGDTGVGK